ncbi:PREDICTED: S-adenosylmethionine mitochondrial carrier protein-like [Priapulus caudatus]|uniref:S-adenosylmethionine mitochondrial carrier protein-like n=1 Tax=Priapulus caudatus TaxID=37621 RepID=A0ABM1EWE0_PRICU|nr:PREDICTED: S-adenosylmethionine mitochondrial carrier protein-like [Priapulus caudatus]
MSILLTMAGGAAGTATDISLFPLDTIKTRLQSSQGFWKSGGFKRLYAGLGPAALGSLPTASAFFCTYETVKALSSLVLPERYMAMGHSSAASCGEVVACLIRVPVEVVKQRAQALHIPSMQILRATLRNEGFGGLYRGYWSTVIREVPFSFIQFPIWELMKVEWAAYQGSEVTPWESAVCGSLSGGISAAVTTPLDVVKTRIMLAEEGTFLASARIDQAMVYVYKQSGGQGLFAGLTPRMMWMSIGGAIFLGVYDLVKQEIKQHTGAGRRREGKHSSGDETSSS